MSSIDPDILRSLEAFDESPESDGYGLRLDLAEIIVRQLRARGWTQSRLAEAAQMRDEYLTRVVHASQNCTFSMVGRLMRAFGLKGKLVIASAEVLIGNQVLLKTSTNAAHPLLAESENYGETKDSYKFPQTGTNTSPILLSGT